MALEKRIQYDQHSRADGQIEIRRDDQIWEDGVFLSHSYHRHVLHPGQDFSQEDVQTKRIAQAIHTPEVVAAFWEAERLSHPEIHGEPSPMRAS